MLFLDKKFIAPPALEMLRRLQNDVVLDDFFLVGGTALALQIGHRLSIDLDMFIDKPFDTQTLSTHLSSKYGFQTSSVAANTLLGFIGGVKVDFIAHQVAPVRDLLRSDGFRLASIEDISAMKLNAIVHSGQRLKDFWDIYFLLEKMPLSQMLAAYEIKYPTSNAMIALKALTYFGEINLDFDRPKIWRKVTLPQMKKRLMQSVGQLGRKF